LKPQQVIILSRDPIYSVFLEMTVREFGFKPKLTAVMDRVEQLSSVCATCAWFIDLDNSSLSVEDVSFKARQKAPDAKVVFLSSAFTQDLAVSCLKQRALALLVKPIVVHRLIQTLNLLRQEFELIEREDVIAQHAERDNPPSKAPPSSKPEPSSKTTPQISYEDHPYLRRVKLTCPVCWKVFETLRFKMWTVPVSDTDTDFCPICPDKVHPELYTVSACPSCYFAHYVGKYGQIKVSEEIRRAFVHSTLLDQRIQITANLNFLGERSLLHGIKSFELAAVGCQSLKLRGYVKLAGEFYLKCSWLCRRLGHSLNEQAAQEKALECFEKTYEPYLSEDGKFPALSRIRQKLDAWSELMSERGIVVTGFLAGELSRRLGLYKKAWRYFDEVMNLPFLHQYSSLMSHLHHTIRLFKETCEKQEKTPHEGGAS